MNPAVTTPKLLDLKPTWAEFAGWTVLFETSPVAECSTSPQPLRIALDRPEHALYGHLAELVAALGRRYGDAPLAWLPPDTYHVTVMDGLSSPHVKRLDADGGKRLAASLSDVPNSLTDPADWSFGVKQDVDSLCTAAKRSAVEYRLAAVECRGHAIVAALEPTARADADHKVLDRHRSATLSRLEESTGLSLVTLWQPHVTLGYAANRDEAGALWAALERDQRRLVGDGGPSITFTSAGTYGFSSMVSYWRISARA